MYAWPREDPWALLRLTLPWGTREAPSDEGQPEAMCEYVRGSLSEPLSHGGVAMREQLC